MKLIIFLIKALLGALFALLIHLPRIIFAALQISYHEAIGYQENLTASPPEHIKRAKRLLKTNKNSLLLYAALEIRFALERMVDHYLSLADNVSKRMSKEYDPLKKRRNMSRLDGNVDFPHKVLFRRSEDGTSFEWGTYRPIDEQKVAEIKGRLGDLLHPKPGLMLGISNDPWYLQTRKFLVDSANYLESIYEKNEPYFLYTNLDNFELVRIDE